MADEKKTTRVRMNITVASGITAWEQGNEYEVDAETARAWIRDRVATKAGTEKSLEEVAAEVEEEFVPRASEVEPENLTGEAPDTQAAVEAAERATDAAAATTPARRPRTGGSRARK